MHIVTTVAELRGRIAVWRSSGLRIALVPTMGNLHNGHLSLVDCAQRVADRVVVSLFVNPKQFSEGEDFSVYPSTFEEDRCKLEQNQVELLFHPRVSEIYPEGICRGTYVEVPGLSGILCGASRPGHFRGVATVVNILFNTVQPNIAIFGEKDFQQLLVIRRMVQELSMNIEILGAAVVREQDGLAMSSRNAYLTAAERKIAPALFETLMMTREQLLAGARDYPLVEQTGHERLLAAGLQPEYFTVRRATDLDRPHANDLDLVVLGAVHLGKARLIDNVRVDLKPGG